MVNPNFLHGNWSAWSGSPRVRDCSYGLLYWLVFLLVLEPDNVSRAISAGTSLALDHEILRILCAAMIGAAVTPLVTGLVRKFPLMGKGSRRRHGMVNALAILGLALALIVVSCFLAAWGFEKKWHPSLLEVREQLVCNWLLVAYAVFALSAIAQAALLVDSANHARAADVPAQLPTKIPVRNRGVRSYVNVADIDWIETQGNYLALHVDRRCHLIRATSQTFETQLNPKHFVRIHRRLIVAVDRIQEVQPIGNGDALVRLFDGRELRSSRSYREDLALRWHSTRPLSAPREPRS